MEQEEMREVQGENNKESAESLWHGFVDAC